MSAIIESAIYVHYNVKYCIKKITHCWYPLFQCISQDSITYEILNTEWSLQFVWEASSSPIN